MIIKPIKTDRLSAGAMDIFTLLDRSIGSIGEKNVLVVTSKIIALCENSVVPVKAQDLEELVKKHSDYYLTNNFGKYGYHFSIVNNTLISRAGIDESNGNDNYVLWPKNAQKTAGNIRKYVAERFGLKKVGVVITDSTVMPLRRGTFGIAIAYSGFVGLNNYIGLPDLFGRPFKVSQANVANGLAAAAVLAMGEGAEQTPICVIEDVPFVKFKSNSPSRSELAYVNIPLNEDLYAPFLKNAKWQKGSKSKNYRISRLKNAI